jgi:transcriptional regulator with XRE-family HTH domain
MEATATPAKIGLMSAAPSRHALGPELGAELRAARLRAGLGLREAARRADLAHPFLAELEAGRKAPGGATAARLVATLPLGAEMVAALYAVAAQVDAARKTREAARGRPNRTRRPLGWRAERRAEAERARRREREALALMAALRASGRYR